MKALRITKWERYEPSDSKKCKVMQWVAVPINHSGLSYLELVSHPDGIRTVGGWLLILQVAAQCPVRGLLVSDSGRILRAREIALKTRTTEADISNCITKLLEVGWIEEVDTSGHHPDVIRTPSGLQDRQDNTLQDRQHAPLAAAQDFPPDNSADLVGPHFVTREGPGWRLTQGQYESLSTGFPSADIDGELAKAAAWCATATKRKTARGMPKFLFGWLNRNNPREVEPTGQRSGPTLTPMTPEQRQLVIDLENELAGLGGNRAG